jgi:hypothetical protein
MIEKKFKCEQDKTDHKQQITLNFDHKLSWNDQDNMIIL